MKFKGKCIRCGHCCVNPSATIEVPSTDAFFYANFGIQVFNNDGKWFIRFHTGTVCKFLKVVDGKAQCSIYDKRPDMCKKFPFESTVLHRSCGYDEVKE